MTYPTYEGLSVNLSEVKKVCGPNRLFIVDEAHGAHYYFSNQCPASAMKCGADAAVTSTHKMLGSIYGTALINVSRDTKLLDPERVRMQYIMMAGGSGENISPFLLLDVESCVQLFATEGERLLQGAIDRTKRIVDACAELENITVARWGSKYSSRGY